MTPMRGELWWCESPDAGRRPCVVLTRDAAIPRLGRVLVALATTNIRSLPSEVALDHLNTPRARLSNRILEPLQPLDSIGRIPRPVT